MEMSPVPEAGPPSRRPAPRDRAALRPPAAHGDPYRRPLRRLPQRSSTGTNAQSRADRPYLEARGPFNFYTMYRAHNYHFKIYGAMFLGQFQPAIETARAMQEAPSLRRCSKWSRPTWPTGSRRSSPSTSTSSSASASGKKSSSSNCPRTAISTASPPPSCATPEPSPSPPWAAPTKP